MRSTSYLSFLYFIPLVLALVLLIFFQRESNPPPVAYQTQGKPLPEFNLPLLGNPAIRLTDKSVQGQVTLLNIWASWCNACFREHKTLMLIKNQYHVPIYGLNYKDNEQDALAWLQQTGNPYQAAGYDPDGKIGKDLAIYGTPETLLLDKKGTIRYIYIGALDRKAWENILWPLIKKYQME